MIAIISSTRWTLRVIAILAFVLTLSGCGGGGVEPEWKPLSREEVTGASLQSRDAIQVDIYVDATTSMIGYRGDPSSQYVTFLDRLEASIETGWVDPDIQFFKFGTRIREIDRDEYRQARETSFYREAGIFRRTNIDQLIQRTDTSRISVVITDLFQNDQDTNSIVSSIRDRCLRQGIKMGVFGIPSSFDGRVYDARVGPYDYASSPGDPSTYRPFYALVFGKSEDLRLFTDTLVRQQLVPAGNTLLLTDYLVESYTGRIERAQSVRGVNKSVNGEGDFNFIMNADVSSADLTAHVALQRYPFAPSFPGRNLRTDARHVNADSIGSGSGGRNSLARNITFDEVRSVTDTLRVPFSIDQPEPGTYVYEISLEAANPGSLTPPEWVRSFSSSNPTASTDPNKTLNLETFVRRVLNAHSTINAPKVSVFSMQVRKND